jgi:hypothetical protein
VHEHEDAFADRDGCGLSADDWTSFINGSAEFYSGPAVLWWALAGSPEHGGVVMSASLSDLLGSLADDAGALAALSASSNEPPVRALGAGLGNLHRRMEAATEIARRLESDEDGPYVRRAEPPKAPLALPKPRVRPHRGG